MRGVILDAASLGTDLEGAPIDLSPIRQALSACDSYATTEAEQTLARLQNQQVVITNKVVIDRPIMQACPSLKLICIAATGMNNVDLQAAEELGIQVCNVAGYSTDSVAQHTFALILTLTTRLSELAQAVQDGAWSKSRFFCLLDYPVAELAGKTLGIIGYGDIGKKVALIAQAFGMTVLVAQRPGSNNIDKGRVPLEQLYQQADIITLHCPLADNTDNLIDAQALAQMKPQTLLVNAGRGGLIDEPALLAALKAKRLAGAALDVLAQEPPSADHPMIVAAREMDNLLITPHVAWSSIEARNRLIKTIGEQIKHWQAV